MKVSIEPYATREESLENGIVWSYGYAADKRFHKALGEQLPTDFQQYDLELFFFLNYAKFPTDVSREEHWWRAVERRWPTKYDDEGRPSGQIIRDSWAEATVRAISNYDTVNLIGGSGQGKTKTLMAFGVSIWDYFAHTTNGARFQFSSVSERKINDACWAMVRQLYTDSNRECSPNICKGEIFDGSMEIRRKGKHFSLQGIIRGVLITNDSRAAQRIDGLTGAHEPLAQILVTDEAQSSPDALSRAGANLRTHATWFWELRSGNPDSAEDYLGKCAKPPEGWDSVDPMKNPDAPLEWETTADGKVGYTIRFDNDNSPGMDDPVKFWYRPTKAFRDHEYPTAIRRQTAEYYRFWKGWFVPGFIDDAVIKWSVIEQMGCNQWGNLNQRGEIINFMSFDPAPSSLDRAPLGKFQLGYEGNKRVLNIAQIYLVPKSNPDMFFQEARDTILAKAIEWQVASGNLIYDNTVNSGLMALLAESGFHSHGLVYHQKASDKPIDTKINKIASQYYGNSITEAAFILEAFIRHGQVRGLNDSVIERVKDEVCSRRTQTTPGGKIILEQKANRSGNQGFRDRMGFSPDIFDILCQAAWFARNVLGFWPGEVDKPLKTNNTLTTKKSGGWTRKYL